MLEASAAGARLFPRSVIRKLTSAFVSAGFKALPYPVPDVAGISRAITYGALVMSHDRVRYTLGRLGPRLIAEAPVDGR